MNDVDGYAREVQDLERQADGKKAKVRWECQNGLAPAELLEASLALIDAWFLWEVELLQVEWGVGP